MDITTFILMIVTGAVTFGIFFLITDYLDKI